MAQDYTQEAPTWPVNELGEIVLNAGQGSSNIVGQLPISFIPIDTRTGNMRTVVAQPPQLTVTQQNTETLYLQEGSTLQITGSTDAVGTLQQISVSGAILKTSAISPGINTPYGPFKGNQKVVVSCSVGSVLANVQDAVLTVKQQTTKTLPLIVWLGDSTTSYSNAQSGNATSLTYNNDGTATVVYSSDQGIRVGDMLSIQGANAPAYNTSQPTACISQVGNAYTYVLNSSSVPSVSPDTGTSIIISFPLKYSAAGPIGLTHNLTAKKLKHVNAGRNGDTLPQMLARFQTDVAFWNPDRVVYCGGINDVYAAGYTLAQMKTNLVTLLQYCQQIGAKLDIITPFPQINTRGSWTAGKNTIFMQWCRYLPQFAIANNLVCENWGAAAAGTVQVQDPTSVTGNPTATMYNADLVHPRNSATYCIAKRMAAIYNVLYPTSGVSGGHNVTEGGLLTNPTFKGTSGTPVNGTGTVTAGNIATGLTVTVTSGTATVTPYQTARTVAADGDVAGNWQGFSMVAVAAGDQFTVTFPALHTLVSNGDTVKFQTLARLSVGGNLVKEFYFFCNSQTATTGNNLVTDMQLASGQMAPYPENFSVTMGADIPVRSPQSVHGAPSAFQPTIRITANAAGTVALELACAFAEKI